MNKDTFNPPIPVNCCRQAGTEQLNISPMPERVA